MSKKQTLKISKMENLKIKSSNFYNNAQSKLTINLSNGTTMCAKVLDSDKKKYLSKKLTIDELVILYFHKENGAMKYSNPIN